MCKKIVLFLMLFFAFVYSHSQELGFSGTVVDAFTAEPIDSFIVEILDEDSTLIKKIAPEVFGMWNIRGTVPTSGDYIFCVMAEGYKNTYINKRFKKNNKHRSTGSEELGMINMFKLPKKSLTGVNTIDEVVVTATKVKMVYRGDTIVYDADAFQLSEGSMLDRLVRMLPGVTLERTGRISVNGRFVSSLLVNGEDFFKGNPRIALENLPAYTVDEVKVYERQSERDVAMGLSEDESGDKPLVMDVNLKREYRTGWIGNMEGGYGTDNHYAARLFGVRYTDQSRLALFYNQNDVNENYTYSNYSSDWNTNRLTEGDVTIQSGGVDLLINDKHKEWKLSGNVTGAIKKNRVDGHSSGIEFYDENDVYKRSSESMSDKSSRIDANVSFNYQPRRKGTRGLYLDIKPRLSYVYNESYSITRDGDFISDINEKRTNEALDSLFANTLSGNTGYFYRQMLSSIRRVLMSTSHSLSTGIKSDVSYRLKNCPDIISLSGDFNYISNERSLLQRNKILTAGSQPENQTRYNEQPMSHYDYRLYGSYRYFLSDIMGWNLYLIPGYELSQSYNSDSRPFYVIDGTEFADRDRGWLSSNMSSIVRYMDDTNTYYSRKWHTVHEFSLQWQMMRYWNDGEMILKGALPLHYVIDRATYTRLKIPQDKRLENLFFDPSVSVYYKNKIDGYNIFEDYNLSYRFTNSVPDLIQMMDYRDDSMPLVVKVGNADLKNGANHNTSFSYKHENRKTGQQTSFSISYNLLSNQISQSMTYDSKTGVRTYRPQTINGNWNVNGRFFYSMNLDKKRRMYLNTTTTLSYGNNSDYMSFSSTENSVRSSVRRTGIGESVDIGYTNGSCFAYFTLNCNYTHSESSWFHAMNLFDVNYKLYTGTELPWKIKFVSDVSVQSHYGYQDNQFNTTDFVLNAGIERSFAKGQITIKLWGYDLLNQLSNIRYVLNAQMQSESYYNGLRRYGMLSFVYHLHVAPKKKK